MGAAANKTCTGGLILRELCVGQTLCDIFQFTMSLLGRTAFKTVAAKRFFSAAAASPKAAIAQNIMLLHEISQATDEATLAKISARGLPNVDLTNAPEELKDLSSYFSLANVSSGNEKFVADPTAWQNMAPLAYAGHELQRAETWPFFVGFV